MTEFTLLFSQCDRTKQPDLIAENSNDPRSMEFGSG